MRDRLIELLKKAESDFSLTGRPVLDIEEYVADRLLAEGVVVPPCKVGDVVYVPWEWGGQEGIANTIVECIQIVRDTGLCGFFIDMKSDDTAFNDVYGFWRTFADIGKTVFLTREEAERALAERREG